MRLVWRSEWGSKEGKTKARLTLLNSCCSGFSFRVPSESTWTYGTGTNWNRSRERWETWNRVSKESRESNSSSERLWTVRHFLDSLLRCLISTKGLKQSHVLRQRWMYCLLLRMDLIPPNPEARCSLPLSLCYAPQVLWHEPSHSPVSYSSDTDLGHHRWNYPERLPHQRCFLQK